MIRAGGFRRGRRQCGRNESCAEGRRFAHDYSVGVGHSLGYPRHCWKKDSLGGRRGARWTELRRQVSASQQFTGLMREGVTAHTGGQPAIYPCAGKIRGARGAVMHPWRAKHGSGHEPSRRGLRFNVSRRNIQRENLWSGD
jgi:hypothetical protein